MFALFLQFCPLQITFVSQDTRIKLTEELRRDGRTTYYFIITQVRTSLVDFPESRETRSVSEYKVLPPVVKRIVILQGRSKG